MPSVKGSLDLYSYAPSIEGPTGAPSPIELPQTESFFKRYNLWFIVVISVVAAAVIFGLNIVIGRRLAAAADSPPV
jgi:hypothetical protein